MSRLNFGSPSLLSVSTIALACLALLTAWAPSSFAQPTLSSAANQSFVVGEPAAPAKPLTITDDATTPLITAANDIRVRIAPSFSMKWNELVTTPIISGTAAGKVSATVSYEDIRRTLVIDVLTDFAAGDDLTINGLSFTDIFAPENPDSMALELFNDGGTDALDDKFIQILAARTNASTSIDIAIDGSELWVANPDHNTVSVIGTTGAEENMLLAEIPVGREPWCVDVHPWNNEVWVTSQRDDRVDIIDRTSRTVVASIDVGFEAFGIAFNPAGSVALVTATGADKIYAIDVETRTVTQTLDAPRRPRGIAWKEDGTRAFVTQLLMPEFFGRLTTVFPSTWTTGTIFVQQVFGIIHAGYPSTLQTLSLAPDGTHLWLPTNMINTTIGGLSGNSLTPTNIVHAAIRPININTGTDLNLDTYFLSEGGSPNSGFSGGTPVGGPIAVCFKGNLAFVANLHSNDVYVMNNNILSTTPVGLIDVGEGPIGIVAHPTQNKAYCLNWLSRTVSVINTGSLSVTATVSTSATEPLSSDLLRGKQLFFTSDAPMSQDGRGACASCHVWGRSDARPWDLSQFGKHLRGTPDMRGIAFTGAHDFTSDKDEMADHHFGIIEFMGGAGLIAGANPPLGPPNAGLSPDMDRIGHWAHTLEFRPDTPYWVGGAQTAAADSGEALFNDPVVGCADCHVPPFYTDSRLTQPFLKHDVGTADPGDLDGAAGYDTPSLVGAWDTAPYLHHTLASTLQSVMTTYNPSDMHGTTSHLNATQIDFIAEFINSIGWPDSTGPAVDAPEVGASSPSALENIYPNPFSEGTSIRFSVERSPSNVAVEIFNVQGRRVRSLLDRSMPRGTHIAGWDSRDDSGKLVAPGVYYARLLIDGKKGGDQKLTVLR